MNLERMKNLHKTATKVTEVAKDLYWVQYTGLILLISKRNMIGFYAEGVWHMVVGYDPGSTKGNHETFLLKTLPPVVKIFGQRSEMVKELRRLLDQDTEADSWNKG